MAEQSLKIIADEIMQTNVKVLGVVFETHFKYIIQREGEKGAEAVEERMAELGYPMRFNSMKTFVHYSAGLADLVILVAKEVFGWQEKDIFDMGNTAPKYSFLIKLLLKYFISLERSLKEAAKYWKKHFTEGELEYELNEKEKYVIIRLKYDILHPLICVFYAGYFLRIAQYVIKSNDVVIKETKCMFKGDSHHEYLIRWE